MAVGEKNIHAALMDRWRIVKHRRSRIGINAQPLAQINVRAMARSVEVVKNGAGVRPESRRVITCRANEDLLGDVLRFEDLMKARRECSAVLVGGTSLSPGRFGIWRRIDQRMCSKYEATEFSPRRSSRQFYRKGANGAKVTTKNCRRDSHREHRGHRDHRGI